MLSTTLSVERTQNKKQKFFVFFFFVPEIEKINKIKAKTIESTKNNVRSF